MKFKRNILITGGAGFIGFTCSKVIRQPISRIPHYQLG